MSNIITVKIAQEIVSHEAIVREAYKDSVGVWTWSVGITNASGHKVFPRYKDNPQSLIPDCAKRDSSRSWSLPGLIRQSSLWINRLRTGCPGQAGA